MLVQPATGIDIKKCCMIKNIEKPNATNDIKHPNFINNINGFCEYESIESIAKFINFFKV